MSRCDCTKWRTCTRGAERVVRMQTVNAGLTPSTNWERRDAVAADNFVFSLKCIGVFAVGALIIATATRREPVRRGFSSAWDDRYDIFNPPPDDD